jgi:Ca2+-binding RTX toxin-like protein
MWLIALDGSDNYAHALGGNDAVHGSWGNDSLYGGTENDWLQGGSCANFIDGGSGTDSVNYLWYQNTGGRVYVDLVQGWAADASNMSYLPTKGIGAAFNDTFAFDTDGSGQSSIENVYDATNAANYIIANERNNEVLGGLKDDVVLGNGGDDYIQGNYGKDTLYGGMGHDVMYGGPDDDVLAGGSGNDYFSGGGADYMSSGGGADAFVFGQNDSPYTIPTGANGSVPSQGSISSGVTARTMTSTCTMSPVTTSSFMPTAAR